MSFTWVWTENCVARTEREARRQAEKRMVAATETSVPPTEVQMQRWDPPVRDDLWIGTATFHWRNVNPRTGTHFGPLN